MLDSRSSRLGLSLGQGHCVVLLALDKSTYVIPVKIGRGWGGGGGACEDKRPPKLGLFKGQAIKLSTTIKKLRINRYFTDSLFCQLASTGRDLSGE